MIHGTEPASEIYALVLVRQMRAGNQEALVSMLTQALTAPHSSAETVILLMKLVDEILETYHPAPDQWLEERLLELAYRHSPR